MMVEMDEPFVWPEAPEDFEAYVFLFLLIEWAWKEGEGDGWRAGRLCDGKLRDMANDYCRWDKSFEDRKGKFNEQQQEKNRPDYLQKPASDRGTIAEQAKELLDGKEWRQNDLEWEEVDQDQKI